MHYLAALHPRVLAAALALSIIISLGAVRTADAQFLPAVLYGGGLKSGQTVEVLIRGVSCGSTTASAQGEWVIQVPVEAPCSPEAGDAISFKLDGVEVTASPAATWESGGIPTGSVATGYSLTAASGGATSDGAGTEGGDDGGSSTALLIGLGVVLLALVAGGGWFISRRQRGA
ncbi:MAG: hypothetical protein AB7I38_03360 [Dehalococcoidia bacterium]